MKKNKWHISFPVVKNLIKFTLKIFLVIISIFFTLFLTYVIGWSMFGLIIIRGVPQAKAIIILAISLFVTVGLYSTVHKCICPFRKLKKIILLYTLSVIAVGVIWAALKPDDALFVARDIVWGDSDVEDYKKFPERLVKKGESTFNFDADKKPDLFTNIQYVQDEDQKESNLDELLKSSHTTSFIIIEDGKILYENYFNGYKRDSIVTSFSVAKSIDSALIGIAIDEGYIDSVDDPIIKYLPEVKGRGYDNMTIKDLLLMSTGIKFIHDDDLPGYRLLTSYKDDTLSYSYTDLRRLALSREGDGKSKEAFNYNPYHNLLLGLILERTTEVSVSEYTQEKLWQPIGAEFDASWSLDSERHGFEKMESGFNGRAIDFAKFGYLYLNNGRIDDKQVITEKWIKESTSPDHDDKRKWLSDEEWVEDFGGYYKYMWWGKELSDGNYVYFANGHLGQCIGVFPEDNIVIVRFGIDEGGIGWNGLMLEIASLVNKNKLE